MKVTPKNTLNTLISRYDGTAKLLTFWYAPDEAGGNRTLEVKDFPTAAECDKFIRENNIEVGIIHGQGAHILGNIIAEDFAQHDDSKRFEEVRHHQR